MLILLLLTLTTFTTVMLSLAENMQAAVERALLYYTPGFTHARWVEESLFSSRRLQEGSILLPALCSPDPWQELGHPTPSHRHPIRAGAGRTCPAVCFGCTWPLDERCEEAVRKLCFLCGTHSPCLEQQQSLSFLALVHLPHGKGSFSPHLNR